jgi:hypothetical protein
LSTLLALAASAFSEVSLDDRFRIKAEIPWASRTD